jgi:hypothetical protein
MRFSRSTSPIAVLAVLAALLAACGGGDSSTPSGPTAGPTPTPAPTPTPTPTPSPVGIGRSCSGIGSGPGTGAGCLKGTSRHFNAVRGAVDVARGSTYRDPNSGASIDMVAGDGTVLTASAYVQRIIDQLDQQGLCGIFDGEEIQVRDSGGDNENFDVITGDGKSWVNYTVTCNPALPLPPPLPVPAGRPDPTCSLPPPPAMPFYCVKQTAALDGEVYGAQYDLIAEDRARATSVVFDFNDLISGTDYGYSIKSYTAYVDGMLAKLRARGLCATFDGEEFNVKRGTNTFSENYDMIRQDGFAIRLYNATCRDAGF